MFDIADLPKEPVPRLLAIMEILRGPNGCPWDREQNPASIKAKMLEEVYEVLEAIDSGDAGHIREELGDVLLHIVFQAQMARETGKFGFDDVVSALNEKLVHRHPHVFGSESGKYTTSAEIIDVWNRRKKEEKAHRESVLDGVPIALPALLYAETLQRKAKTVGFDWKDSDGPMKKVQEELGELQVEVAARAAAGKKEANQEKLADEMGDLLFSMVNLSRHLGLNAEEILAQANRKFERRFRAVESQMKGAGNKLEDCPVEELEKAWESVKAAEVKLG
jgi:MazG family protein